MFRKLRIWHKLLLMVVPVAVVAGLLGALVVRNAHQQVIRSRSEVAGVHYLEAIPRLLRPLQLHETYAALALGGDPSAPARMREAAAALDRQLAAMARTDTAAPSSPEASRRLAAIRHTWGGLRDGVLGLSALESEQRHRALANSVVNLGKHVADESQLSTTPLEQGQPLTQALVTWMPRVIASLSTLRARGAAITERRAAFADDILVLASLGEATREAQREVDDLLAIAFERDRRVRLALWGASRRAYETGASYRELVEQRLRATSVNVEPAAHARLADRAIDEYFTLHAGAHRMLLRLLAERSARAELERNVALASTIAALLLAVLAAWRLSRGIRRQVADIERTLASVGAGNLSARAEVFHDDELGKLASSLNATFETTLSLIQSKEQRDRMQASIMKLLDEVSGVGEGDLTREAEVTADMTGAIADSFNLMIGQLRRIIGDVKRTSHFVSDSASAIQGTAIRLAAASERQATQTLETSAAVTEMAASIRHVSESAATSADVARQARASAEQGAHAVHRTMQGMDAIREQVQETARRIKRLGENSQEIGEVIQLIGDIADRTSILALNASIQAALAGEAGRGFAVVADEVERLAERATASTKRIAALIKTTQTETAGALAAMDDTTREVVAGSALAREAGETLGEIEKVSDRLAELIVSISSAAERQARGSDVVARSMSSIAGIAQHTTADAQGAAVSIARLAESADTLRDSVSRFVLPGEAARRSEAGSSPGVPDAA